MVPTAMTAPTLRLFVALWPSPAVLGALVGLRDSIRWPAGARPTASDKLHLTLHFLGEVGAARLRELALAIDAVPAERFELTLDRVTCWPGGLVVSSPSRAGDALRARHAAIAGALRRFGVPVETRAFRPHVTLARRCASPPALPPLAPIRWPVEGHALVESTPDGRYRIVHTHPHRPAHGA
jgi:2'-5' RNA ligase